MVSNLLYPRRGNCRGAVFNLFGWLFPLFGVQHQSDGAVVGEFDLHFGTKLAGDNTAQPVLAYAVDKQLVSLNRKRGLCRL